MEKFKGVKYALISFVIVFVIVMLLYKTKILEIKSFLFFFIVLPAVCSFIYTALLYIVHLDMKDVRKPSRWG